eukprot:CAMPEP_0206316874 /NCGR_PEP_ID=MMETSP0106_2-20121207/16329_1 /ASSEMBLY_ACC=CAM_ASM_000206 /TAXON_ID=81532 /ORGANISM="Acanthoeca-like sp., Strain 10tr" /LENGTH=43 /DNA_ID= /DNA_START= /DNA_END= /DNA_ORIENTATION=
MTVQRPSRAQGVSYDIVVAGGCASFLPFCLSTAVAVVSTSDTQ